MYTSEDCERFVKPYKQNYTCFNYAMARNQRSTKLKKRLSERKTNLFGVFRT